MTVQPLDEEAIFKVAAEIANQDARVAYLQQVCATDAALLNRVVTLLRARDEAPDFLESPAAIAAVTIEHAGPQLIGTVIGPYKLREQIGEGGMGVVYVAEQTEPVQRKVALKIIKPGMASRDVVARFEAERQALAMMDHPNIAKVFDAGTTGEVRGQDTGDRGQGAEGGEVAPKYSPSPDPRPLSTTNGQPYFVMELVQGPPITEYCDQHRLNTRERLELFEKVCRAVQHAHQKGVIHRDLKPSNVLVPRIDGQPVPKVIDFGVAKAIGQKLTEQTVYTQFSQLVGTPLYMSPEQAEFGVVDIDTRSDVYSLGVLLYELLTGSTPFDSETLKQAGFDEMRRIIREDEPPRPSARVSTLAAQALSTVAERRNSDARSFGQSLHGELDWLVMRALEKDRNRRYESASALAADVERYLQGAPVDACPPSSLYRLRKFATRNKAALTTATVVLVALLLGIAGTSWQAWRATNAMALADKNLQLADKQREQAEANLQLADKQREQALENFRRARDTVDKYLEEARKNKLLEPDELHPVRERLAELAREYYAQFLATESNDSEIQIDVAKAYYRLGRTLENLGQQEDSGDAIQKALEICNKLEQATENADLQRDLADFYNELAGDQHTFNDAYDYCQKALAIAKGFTKPAHRAVLGSTYLRIGFFRLQQFKEYGDAKYRDEAFTALGKGIEVLEPLTERFPGEVQYKEELAEGYILLGAWHNWNGNKEQAVSFHQKALQIHTKLAEANPENEHYQGRLAVAYFNAGELDKALAIEKRMAESYPHNNEYQYNLVQDYEALGNSHENDGSLSEAIRCHQAAVDIFETLVSRNPEADGYQAGLGRNLQYLGKCQGKSGMHEEAIVSLKRALLIFKTHAPYARGRIIDCYEDLSVVQDKKGEIDEAIASRQHAIQLGQEMIDAKPQQLRYRAAHASQFVELAKLQRKAGRLSEALETCQKGKELLEAVYADGKFPEAPPDHLRMANGVLKGCVEEIRLCQEAIESAETSRDHETEEPNKPPDD